MKIYLAGEAYGEKVFKYYNYNFNRLDSFFYVRNNCFKKFINKYNDYLLDSGAFTFIMSPKKNKIGSGINLYR